MARGKRSDPAKVRADQEAILRDTERFTPGPDDEMPSVKRARTDRMSPPPSGRVVKPRPKSPPVVRGGKVIGRRRPANTA